MEDFFFICLVGVDRDPVTEILTARRFSHSIFHERFEAQKLADRRTFFDHASSGDILDFKTHSQNCLVDPLVQMKAGKRFSEDFCLVFRLLEIFDVDLFV